MKRNATAVWNGTGKEGSGHLTTQSTILNQTQYSFGSRFAEGIGTNPEELIAAAHAGCFTMKLSFVLNSKGFTATELSTKCVINLDTRQGKIVESHLSLTANVPNIDPSVFEEAVREAEADCMISALLNTAIVVEYTLMD